MSDVTILGLQEESALLGSDFLIVTSSGGLSFRVSFSVVQALFPGVEDFAGLAAAVAAHTADASQHITAHSGLSGAGVASHSEIDTTLNILSSAFSNLETSLSMHISGLPTFSDLTLLNGWAAFGSPYVTLSYTKTVHGLVSLRGFLVPTNATSATVALLPVGFRPLQPKIFTAWGGTAGAVRVDVGTGGYITCPAYASASGVSFDGLSFQLQAV